MSKKQQSKSTLWIAILSTMLVLLLITNITYAYFTDQTKSDIEMKFGIVDIQAKDFSVASATKVMPGDKITLNGKVTAENSTGTMWLKIGVPTGSNNEKIVLKYNGTEITNGTTNGYFDDANDGSGHTYTEAEITSMKSLVAEVLTENIATYVNSTTNNTDLLLADGVSKEPVDSSLNIDFSTATNKLELTKNKFGNLFQNVTIDFSIIIQSIQAEHITREEAIETFNAGNEEVTSAYTNEDAITVLTNAMNNYMNTDAMEILDTTNGDTYPGTKNWKLTTEFFEDDPSELDTTFAIGLLENNIISINEDYQKITYDSSSDFEMVKIEMSGNEMMYSYFVETSEQGGVIGLFRVIITFNDDFSIRNVMYETPSEMGMLNGTIVAVMFYANNSWYNYVYVSSEDVKSMMGGIGVVMSGIDTIISNELSQPVQPGDAIDCSGLSGNSMLTS